MRKIIVTLVSMLLGLNAVAQNKGIDFLLNKLYDGGKSNYVMIIAHRGNWRNAPENSLQGYKQCIDGGIDGIEIDVHMTKIALLSLCMMTHWIEQRQEKDWFLTIL